MVSMLDHAFRVGDYLDAGFFPAGYSPLIRISVQCTSTSGGFGAIILESGPKCLKSPPNIGDSSEYGVVHRYDT